MRRGLWKKSGRTGPRAQLSREDIRDCEAMARAAARLAPVLGVPGYESRATTATTCPRCGGAIAAGGVVACADFDEVISCAACIERGAPGSAA